MPDKIDLILRREQPEDYRAVEELTREAFWNQHGPGCDEHYLLHMMRTADCFIPELSVVAEAEGTIAGHIAYTKAILLADNGKSQDVISFGPLSVLPRFQGRGVGGALIEFTKSAAKEMGYQAILIYGDPQYYGRFGFAAAESFHIGTADDLYAPALQALELVPGALPAAGGRFFEDAVYSVDEQAALAFDKGFAPKEPRDDLPSQIRFCYLNGLSVPRKRS